MLWHILISALALLLRGQACSDKCFGAPASATTLLLHGQARSDQCFGTPAISTALLLRGQARFVQYRTVPSDTFCTVSFSLSIRGLCRQILICCIPRIIRYMKLNDKDLNDE